jgi:hypothetical protein
MKRQVIAVLLGSIAALPAFADTPAAGKSRDQVRAELIAAQQAGLIVPDLEGGTRVLDSEPSA